MAIQRVEAIPFRIPLRPEIGTLVSSAWSMEAAEHVLVKITDSEGLVGWGEATPRATLYGDTQASTVAIIDRWIAPMLIGMEPFALEAAWECMDRVAGNLPAKAAVDIALHDLLGKRLGVSVGCVLGGVGRKRVPLGTNVPLGPPEKVAETASEAVARGIRLLKIKVGEDPDRDVAAFKAIRRAVGEDVTMAVDANQGYSVATAIRVLNRMQEWGLAWAEEPVKAWDAAGKLKVAQSVRVPLLLDESVFTPEDTLREIGNGACGMISIKPIRSGFTRSRAIASLAQAANIPCLLGTARECGPGTVAAAHFAAQCRSIQWTEIPGQPLFEATLLQEPPRLEGGSLLLPGGPGLGVEIDESQLRHYRVDV